MSYASLQDLIDRYGERELLEVADRAVPPAETIDSEIVDRAIEDARGEIDSYLSPRYAVPLASVPESVRSVACVIARYRLHDDRATERIRYDYEAAIRWLRDVSTGRAVIAELVPVGRSVGAAVRAPATVFDDATIARMS